MKSAVEQTEALVLRQTSYGDHDKILGLYTKKYGKISAFAPSAKKSQKRFGTSLDLFSNIQSEVARPQGAGKTLWRLQRVDIVESNIQLRGDLLALSYISYFADCVWNLLADEDPHEDVFEFMKRTIVNFATARQDFSMLLELEVELLKLCGYGPRFFECAECNTLLSNPKVFFSFSKGGVMCSSCSRSEQGLWMPLQVFESAIHKHSTSEKDFLAVRNVLDHFVTFIVGRELKSQSFRREVRHAGV